MIFKMCAIGDQVFGSFGGLGCTVDPNATITDELLQNLHTDSQEDAAYKVNTNYITYRP